MENRKNSIIIYPADFLASVHNFKKSEIANLIVAICEFNLFGATSVKLHYWTSSQTRGYIKLKKISSHL